MRSQENESRPSSPLSTSVSPGPKASGEDPLFEYLSESPVVPVVVLDKVEDACPIAEALLRGGINIIEITLRTRAALPAIAALRSQFPQMRLGAGTVTSLDQVDALRELGVDFVVTPGFTPALVDAIRAAKLPCLPGVATVSEALVARDMGFSICKLFPANILGGPAFLRSLRAVLPDLYFCPTGGISLDQVPAYLALDNVVAVGGSWLCPKGKIAAKDWGEIRRLARQSVGVACRSGRANPLHRGCDLQNGIDEGVPAAVT